MNKRLNNKYLNRIKEVKQKYEIEQDDKEAAHFLADEVLCNLLESLGYVEIVEEFNGIHKWYA